MSSCEEDEEHSKTKDKASPFQPSGYTFKCCNTKRCSIVFCIQCMHIFHVSCKNRNSFQIEVNPGQILCSRVCKRLNDDKIKKDIALQEEIGKLRKENISKTKEVENLRYEKEKEIEQLVEEIDKLKKQKQEKSHCIEKQITSTHDITDIALLNEEKCVQVMRKENETTKDQSIKMISILERKEDLEIEVESLKSENTKLTEKFKNIDELKKNMLTTIEVLTSENECFLNDLKKTRMELFEFKTKNKWSNEIYPLKDIKNSVENCIKKFQQFYEEITNKQNNVIKLISPSNDKTDGALLRNHIEVQMDHLSPIKSQTPQRKPQLLAIGDESIRGCGLMFKNATQSSFDITYKNIRNATLNEIVHATTQLCRNSTQQDWAIIFTGFQDAKRNYSVKIYRETIKSLKSIHANIIIVCPPYFKHRPILDKFIYEQNMIISEERNNKDKQILFLDSTFFYDSDDGYLTYETKKDLVYFLVKRHLRTNHPIQYTEPIKDKIVSRTSTIHIENKKLATTSEKAIQVSTTDFENIDSAANTSVPTELSTVIKINIENKNDESVNNELSGPSDIFLETHRP